jgi:hypothetical protein
LRAHQKVPTEPSGNLIPAVFPLLGARLTIFKGGEHIPEQMFTHTQHNKIQYIITIVVVVVVVVCQFIKCGVRFMSVHKKAIMNNE